MKQSFNILPFYICTYRMSKYSFKSFLVFMFHNLIVLKNSTIVNNSSDVGTAPIYEFSAQLLTESKVGSRDFFRIIFLPSIVSTSNWWIYGRAVGMYIVTIHIRCYTSVQGVASIHRTTSVESFSSSVILQPASRILFMVRRFMLAPTMRTTRGLITSKIKPKKGLSGRICSIK